MKHWWLTAALICFGSTAEASPYLRLLDLSHPKISAEALFSPTTGIKDTQAASFLSIVTHSTSDGCLLPKVVCEDWSPLQIGGVFTGANKLFGIGPQINLAPLMGLDSFVPTAWGLDLSLSLGPKWVVAPDQKWKGYFRLSIGPQIKF